LELESDYVGRCPSPNLMPAEDVRENRMLYHQARKKLYFNFPEDNVSLPPPPSERELMGKVRLEEEKESYLCLQGPARVPRLFTPENIYEPGDKSKMVVSHKPNKRHVAAKAKISNLCYDENKTPVPDAKLSMFNGDIIVDLKGKEKKPETTEKRTKIIILE